MFAFLCGFTSSIRLFRITSAHQKQKQNRFFNIIMLKQNLTTVEIKEYWRHFKNYLFHFFIIISCACSLLFVDNNNLLAFLHTIIVMGNKSTSESLSPVCEHVASITWRSMGRHMDNDSWRHVAPSVDRERTRVPDLACSMLPRYSQLLH